MASLRVLIVEDEPLAVHRITMALERVPDIVIVEVASTGPDALDAITRHSPDVVLLDISLPGFSGIEVAEKLSDAARPLVIFTTAYDKHAVKAFDLAAVDYLLKPVEFERLAEAMERARRRLTSVRDDTAVSAQIDEGASTLGGEIWVSTRRGIAKLDVGVIEYLEAERDYVRIHAGENEYMMPGPLINVVETLNSERFVKVHRSYVVAWKQVAGIERRARGTFELMLCSGTRIPVGRSYSRMVRALAQRQ